MFVTTFQRHLKLFKNFLSFTDLWFRVFILFYFFIFPGMLPSMLIKILKKGSHFSGMEYFLLKVIFFFTKRKIFSTLVLYSHSRYERFWCKVDYFFYGLGLKQRIFYNTAILHGNCYIQGGKLRLKLLSCICMKIQTQDYK